MNDLLVDRFEIVQNVNLDFTRQSDLTLLRDKINSDQLVGAVVDQVRVEGLSARVVESLEILDADRALCYVEKRCLLPYFKPSGR